MLEVVRETGTNAMLTFADPDAAALAQFREELTNLGVNCFFPGRLASQVGFDKLQTAHAAAQLGVPVPDTTTPADRDSLNWPRVWKPRSGSASAGVTIARSGDEEPNPEPEYMIVQQFVAGDEVDVEVLCDLNSRVVRTSSWRKMRSRHGETELAVTEDFPDLVRLSTVFAEAVGFVGPVDFDWILGENGPVLIEANTRFGGGYPVSHLAGAGFIDALVRLARGETVQPASLCESGIFMMKRLEPFGGRLADAPEMLAQHRNREMPS
jgi:carbamoyl-phosphate synthase large subunit